MIVERINEFVKTSKPAQSLKIVLSKPIDFTEGRIIRIPINNKVEISMMENVEQPLLDFLRNGLQNTDLKIEYVVSENNEERKPYTGSEKLEAMIKKNPALKKLKEDLGLDADY